MEELETSLQVHDKTFSLQVLNLPRFFPKGRVVLQVLLHHLSHGTVAVSKKTIPGVYGEFLPLFLQVAVEMKAILYPTQAPQM